MLNRLFVLAISGQLFAACGAPLKKGGEGPLQPPGEDEGYASGYFVEDESCQSATGSTSIDDATSIYTFQNGRVEQRPFSVDATTSIPSLRNPTVQATFYNMHQQRDCREYDNDADCTTRPKIVSPAKSLKVCAGKSYDRDSVEGVSLTSLALLSQAREFYVDIEGAKATIAAANMLVLPKVETVLRRNGKTVRRVDTDNLAYAPSFAGAPTFVVFPKGRTAAELGYWSGLSLWEIPWGLAHEYGHHIFRTHTGVESLGNTKLLANGLAIEVPLQQVPFDEEFDATSFGLTAKNSGIRPLWSAVNEGFADLFAHYSLAENSDLDSLDCFSENRDPLVAAFADGRRKQLTSEVLQEFLGTKSAEGDGCKSPRLSDVHALGAIIAYGTNRLMDAADIHSKPKALLDWAESLGDKSSALSDASDLADLLAPLVAAVKKQSGRLGPESCSTFEEVFPLYAEAIFRSDAVECL